MTEQWHAWLVNLHIVAGLVGLLAFWLPPFARKGGRLHRRAGWVFAGAMLFTGASALVAAVWSTLDPLGTHPGADPVVVRRFIGGLLGYLSILTFSSAWMGLRAVRFRTRHVAFRNALDLGIHASLLIAALAALVIGLLEGQVLFIAMSVVGLLLGPANLAYMLRPPREPQAWMYQHFSSMIGAGIAAHTAFLAFGARRIMPSEGLVPELLVWVGPAVIGTIAITALNFHYRSPLRARRGGRPGAREATPSAR